MSLRGRAACLRTCPLFVFGDWENTKNGVPDDFDHLSTLGEHCSGRTIEIGVEHSQKILSGKRIRQRRRVAEIAVPNHRAQAFTPAPLDRSVQDTAAYEGSMECV